MDLCNNVACHDYHAILLSETSLTPDFSDEELGLSNYNIYRRDRDANQTGKSRNGGVLIAVRKDIKSWRLEITETTSEEVWVGLSEIQKILCCFYTPPRSTAESYETHCKLIELVEQEYEDYDIYIAGDYNLPKILWDNDT